MKRISEIEGLFFIHFLSDFTVYFFHLWIYAVVRFFISVKIR